MGGGHDGTVTSALGLFGLFSHGQWYGCRRIRVGRFNASFGGQCGGNVDVEAELDTWLPELRCLPRR